MIVHNTHIDINLSANPLHFAKLGRNTITNIGPKYDNKANNMPYTTNNKHHVQR